MRLQNKLVFGRQNATVHRHSAGEIIVAGTDPFALDSVSLLGKEILLGFKLAQDITISLTPQVHEMNRVALGF
jgi:hypothetical protein